MINRVKHSVNEQSNALDTGIGYLERYFSLISFCAFIDEWHDFPDSKFSDWVKDHKDIWHMLSTIRRTSEKLQIFRPVNDLSALASHRRASVVSASSINSTEGIPEYNVIKNRAGTVLTAHTILKIDHWNPEGQTRTILAGAPNFRQLYSTQIYATAQPTLSALRSIIGMLHEKISPDQRIIWINVREEPVIYIDNEPYVLRDRYATLRNIKSYSGITVERLELMESRLKDDVLTESVMYKNRILVHCETSSENIFPSWVNVDNENDTLTLKEIFYELTETFPNLIYKRLPMTAEEPLEPIHFDEIMKSILEMDPRKGYIVFNCQMGASRSTTGAVVAALISRWGKGEQTLNDEEGNLKGETIKYRIVHSILRVLKNGLECKLIVDNLIDQAAAVVNLRESIERYRHLAETSTDPNDARSSLLKGIAALKRYALLIIYQGYLTTVSPESDIEQIEPFSEWFNRHFEFKILFDDLDRKSFLEILHMEEEGSIPGDVAGALTTEISEVIKNRLGQVLSTMTILKFDHFPGCQKMSLPERIEGAPNFRGVFLGHDSSVYGLAMPTKLGFINALERVGKPVLWFCLREEPVVYINGRPYVLRIVKDPIVNLEMTGIVSERVEQMEERMKLDVFREIDRFDGKLLLHEEDASTGSMIAVWETVKYEDVETTADIVQSIKSKGYQMDYVRIPITDEQAPIPRVFDEMLKYYWGQRVGLASRNAIYNCQMGRGRTTTGMVITVLLHIIRNHQDESKYSMDGSGSGGGSVDDEYNDSTIKNESTRFLAGEYKLIIQLVQVLEHGWLSKRLVDKAIDLCSHIQNLRTAIYDFKLHDKGNRGLNYLLRYFYLIVVGEYLMQTYDQEEQDRVHFEKWLLERREITNMVSKLELLDFS